MLVVFSFLGTHSTHHVAATVFGQMVLVGAQCRQLQSLRAQGLQVCDACVHSQSQPKLTSFDCLQVVIMIRAIHKWFSKLKLVHDRSNGARKTQIMHSNNPVCACVSETIAFHVRNTCYIASNLRTWCCVSHLVVTLLYHGIICAHTSWGRNIDTNRLLGVVLDVIRST